MAFYRVNTVAISGILYAYYVLENTQVYLVSGWCPVGVRYRRAYTSVPAGCPSRAGHLRTDLAAHQTSASACGRLLTALFEHCLAMFKRKLTASGKAGTAARSVELQELR
jgi:hypothetical protein